MGFAIYPHESAIGAHLSPYPDPPLPPPSPSHPSGLSQSTGFSALLPTSNFQWSSILHMVIHRFQCYYFVSFHPSLLPRSQLSTLILISLFILPWFWRRITSFSSILGCCKQDFKMVPRITVLLYHSHDIMAKGRVSKCAWSNHMNPLKASFPWLVAGEKVIEIRRMRTQVFSGGLVVRRLASTVGSKSLIHGQGTKITHASWPKRKKKSLKQRTTYHC